MIRCWNCGMYQWVCNLKHFCKDILIPTLIGGLIGSVIGAILALLHNWLFPLGG